MARTRRILLLLLSLPSSGLLGAWTRHARADDAPAALGVGCIGLTVSDADRASEFYMRVLDFRRELGTEVAGESWEKLQGVFGLRARTVRVRLGNECLDLTEYLAPRGRPIPADARSNDRSFQHVAIVVSDMDEAYRRLRDARVEHASTGPQRLPDWNPNAGGIDHTAIVVGDTEASLRFWRGALGFRVAGTSENWGTEQEHLNNVFGARLRITALGAPEGPGIELEYLTRETAGRSRRTSARMISPTGRRRCASPISTRRRSPPADRASAGSRPAQSPSPSSSSASPARSWRAIPMATWCSSAWQ